MGVSDWLGIGKTISEPIKAVGDLYTTDKARIEADTKFEEVQQKRQLAQLENNRVLAASLNIFNSGGLALICWTAGFLLLMYYFPQILIATYVWGKASVEAGRCGQFPMKSDDIMNLVYVIYGYGVHHLVKSKIGN